MQLEIAAVTESCGQQGDSGPWTGQMGEGVRMRGNVRVNRKIERRRGGGGGKGRRQE